jgi:phosphoglycolate phosphatase
MVKAVIFDLDGTILYSLPDIYQALQVALLKHGLEPVTLDEVKDALGSGVYHLIDKVTNSSPLETKNEILKTYETYYTSNPTRYSKPYDEIIELFEMLKQNHIKIGIASNKTHALVKMIIKTFFNEYVDAYRGEIYGKPIKPDPNMIIDVLQQLSISKEEFIYVGDSEQDIMAAKKIGCRHIAVSYGYRNIDTLKQHHPENIVHSVKTLKEIIERIIYGSD